MIHFDVPEVPADWRLRIDGLVEHEVSLSLDDLRARPLVRRIVTMECAGNGRARLEPHVFSQPWLAEAVGTGEWGGVGLAPLLEEAGVADGAVEVLFGALDRGIDGGIEQSYERSLPLAEALAGEVLLAYELNGAPLPPQHGFPLRLVVPGWYGMTSVKWLERITVLDAPFEGYQQAHAYRLRRGEDDAGDADHAHAAAGADGAAGHAGLPHEAALRRVRTVPGRGPCLVRARTDRRGRHEHRRRRHMDRGRARARARPVGLVALDVRPGTQSPATTSSPAAHATRRAPSSRSSRNGTSAAM